MINFGNNVAHAGPCRHRNDLLRSYDSHLPLQIRRRLWECVNDWCATCVKKTYDRAVARLCDVSLAIQHVLKHIDCWEQSEILLFPYMYPARFGVYPAKAAYATVVRYDEASLHRCQASRAA